MSEAPERITAWLSKDGSTRFEGGRLFPAGVEVEYIRADRIEELEAKLAKAADVIEWALICGDEHQVRDWVHDAINVLSELTGGPKNGNE